MNIHRFLVKPAVTFLPLLFIFLSAGGQNETLVWSDEFNTDGAPNPAYWIYDLGKGQDGWGNHEMETYTQALENVYVKEGLLSIVALKNDRGWTSARIKSQGRKSFIYGRIQFRAKLPAGSGTWPALWLLGENVDAKGWPGCGEIDVMEHVGRNPAVVQSAMHTPSSSGNTVNKGSTDLPTYHTGFHIYEVNWTPDRMDFSVDGKKYYTYEPKEKNSSTWPFDLPQFLILNVAMGGNFGSDPKLESNGLKNGIDPSIHSAEMLVDYVRVYQLKK
jgi:beta-glucanase (GH16 family)